jgi:hypothetical protein
MFGNKPNEKQPDLLLLLHLFSQLIKIYLVYNLFSLPASGCVCVCADVLVEGEGVSVCMLLNHPLDVHYIYVYT